MQLDSFEESGEKPNSLRGASNDVIGGYYTSLRTIKTQNEKSYTSFGAFH